MRHLGSLLLCLLVGPAVYLLAGVGAVKYNESLAHPSGSRHAAALALAIVALVVAGSLYALLVLARLSPLGTVLTGLALIGVSLWAIFDSSGFVNAMPRSVFGLRGVLSRPVLVAPVLAMPLLFTVFSPRRWRRWGSAPAAVAPAPGYSPPPVAPAGFQSQSGSPAGYSHTTVAPAYGSTPYSAAPTYAPVAPAYPQQQQYGASPDDPESTRRLPG